MHNPLRPGTPETSAAVLLWQSRFRLLLIVVVGGITLILNWAGKLETDSIIAVRYGVDFALNGTALISVLYFGFIGLLALRMLRTHRIGAWAIPVTLLADVLAFNGTVLFSARPEWFERALILSTFTTILALLFLGWRNAVLSVLFAVAGYMGALLVAERLGSDVQINDALWTGGLFMLGTTAFIVLHAEISARLSLIVHVFNRAREGVFAISSDAHTTEHPDITVIGIQYDKMREELKELILTDPLTQCYNPRGFEQMSAREFARTYRVNASVSMLAVDLDHFKSINDTYGHLVGDSVLRDIGMLLRKTARISDVVARVGGEEFVILAPDTDEAGAQMFAQRLLDACRGHEFQSVRSHKVAVSIGFAHLGARTQNIAEVLRSRADAALYVAKRSGRDRAVLWSEGMELATPAPAAS